MFILKQLRRKKNVSQTDLAVHIGVSLRTIQLYEKKDANIPIKNLTKIAQFFDVTIAELYAMENNIKEPELSYDTQKKIEKVANSVRVPYVNTYIINVPLICKDIQKRYTKEYESEKFLESLPSIDFVQDTLEEGYYAAFEITNNAMTNGAFNSFPEKTIAYGKLQTRKEFIAHYSKNPYWILVYDTVIMCKQILDYNKKQETITCHSLNISPEFSDFKIELGNVKQLFMVVKKQIDI